MKRVLFIVFLSIILTVPGWSQTKVQLDIAESFSYGNLKPSIIKGVYRELADYLLDNNYILAANDHTLKQLMDLEWKNQKFSKILPAEHNPVKGGIYNLYYELTSEGNYEFLLSHANMAADVSLYRSNPQSLSWLQLEDGQKLVAYELVKKCFGLSQSGQIKLNELNEAKERFLKGQGGRKYRDKVLSWLAPSLIHIENGQVTSGSLLLSGELLSVSGGIFTYVKANSLVKTLKDDDWSRKRNDGTAMPDAERAALEKRYQTCQVANYVCWGTAAVLYAVNVATSYKLISDKRYVIVPSVQQNSIGDFAFGATLTYSF